MDNQIDEKKVDAAAHFIEIELSKGEGSKLAAALAVGKYIYKEFFDSDIYSYSSHSRNSPSLLALVQHPQIRKLKLPHRTLANDVQVAVQYDMLEEMVKNGQLPKKVLELGFIQQLRLYPAKTPEIRIKVAKRALKENLTGNQIQALVAALNAQCHSLRPLIETT